MAASILNNAASFEQLQETVFSCATDYFDDLLRAVARAHTSIDLEVYIFEASEIGQRVAQALIVAAQRGVRVRLLVDGVGSAALRSAYAHQLNQQGVQTRVYHPLPWRYWQLRSTKPVQPWWRMLFNSLARLNKRNHRKVCIIDQQIVYIGSFNISQVHMTHAQGGENWRDVAVKVSGIELSGISLAFQQVWTQFHWPMQWPKRPYYFCLNNTRQRRRLLRTQLLRKIRKAEYRIWITNAYFIPDRALLKALRHASAHAIDIRILLPRKSDVFFMPWASSLFYQDLIDCGVRIFEYLPSVLHQKTLMIDDWVTLGSSNLNQRSVRHDLEVDVVLRRKTSKTQIETIFLQDLKQSEEIASTHSPRVWYQRLIGRMFLYFQYWM